MEQKQVLTHDGSLVTLGSDLLLTLKNTLQGKLLTPDDPEFDQARQLWNAMIDNRPALIVKCAAATDVIKAVSIARDYNLLVSVKGGGHNFAGLSVCAGGLMIDLSDMRQVQVNLRTKTARAEAGALLRDLDSTTQAFGLATTSGTVSNTGLGGLTLGGGQGWLMNKYGLTCDNLLSAELVTADGQLITASKDQHPDLFWALRGGGGNFGIATAFEYQLHAVGPTILGGLVIYSLGQAKQVLEFYRHFSMQSPDELTLIACLLCLPDGSPVIAIAAGWVGDLAEGRRELQPLRQLGTPLLDTIGEMPYLQLQTIFDEAVPYGMPRYGKMGYTANISDDFIQVALANWEKRVSPYALMLFNTIKGAVSRVGTAETAFFHRQPQWHYEVISQWTEAGQEQTNIDWVKTFWQDTVAFTHGASINFLGTDDGQDRVKLSFGSNYPRLAAIKARYDPGNLFRLNANILPRNYEKATPDPVIEK